MQSQEEWFGPNKMGRRQSVWFSRRKRSEKSFVLAFIIVAFIKYYVGYGLNLTSLLTLLQTMMTVQGLRVRYVPQSQSAVVMV